MNKDLLAIFDFLEKERGIKREVTVAAIEEALVTAARKGSEFMNNISVSIDPKTGNISSIAEKEIVEEVKYPAEEIALDDAREIDPDCALGHWIDIEVDPKQYGRIAAQVARQLITQRLRFAEKSIVYEQYKHRIGELITGTVTRISKGRTLIIDLGKVHALMPFDFYPRNERYHIGDRVTAVLSEVQNSETNSAEIILSRSHAEFVTELFKQEVPEINEGVIEIKKIVRDPGLRTKIAVLSNDSNVDPIGSMVGMRGSRIQHVIKELNNEKIDILFHADDPFELLQNALHPIEPIKIELNDDESKVSIVVRDEDYPAILGKWGSNARLIGNLVGIEIQVVKETIYNKTELIIRKEIADSENPALDEEITKIEGVNQLILDDLIGAGLSTPRKLLPKTPQELASHSNISLEMAESILAKVTALINNKKADVGKKL